MWRLAHLFFADQRDALVLTGMAVFYAETGWASAVMEAFGGPKVAGLVHRISAAIPCWEFSSSTWSMWRPS